MGVRWYKTGGQRYYVIEVSGCPIRDDSIRANNQKFSTTFAVLDRNWNHEEMAIFRPEDAKSIARARKRAYAFAAELNACEKADVSA
jgi:hypothetical protein